jgi:glutathione S-transferase
MLTLYLSPGFSSMAPHIALHEIGVDFESRWISFAKREQYAPEYLALNPEGKVPILLVDGRPLTEVAAILHYLAKRFPNADLFPADDLEAEAHVISWMSFIASTVHPARRIGGVRVERESGVGIANPLAMILSSAMMLRYSLDRPEQAARIENAVKKVLKSGLRTGDIWEPGCERVGTRAMGDAVLKAL